MAYEVKIDAYEGPLDLLLHLINRLEIDIYDIPMAKISDQYLLYIHTMQDLELDGASEYLVMAATLLAIKSKMLLPKYEPELEDELDYYEEDPRDELVEQLIEYKKYKEAAEALKEKEEERSRIYSKPPSDLSKYADAPDKERGGAGATIYDMLGAYHKLMRRKKLQKPETRMIAKQEVSIEDRMSDLVLELGGGRRSFDSFFPGSDKTYIVITFLAMLELMKRNLILVEQEGNFGEIILAGRKEGVAHVQSQ